MVRRKGEERREEERGGAERKGKERRVEKRRGRVIKLHDVDTHYVLCN